MNNKVDLMYGSLLHDIGKIIYRGNNPEFSKGTHSKLGGEYIAQFPEFQNSRIKECIRFHHYKELAAAKISDNSLAYITYIADNIASGIDRRDAVEEGEENSSQHANFSFKKTAPLSSIYNILNKDSKGQQTMSYSFGSNEVTHYPNEENNIYSSGDYSGLKETMSFDLRNILKVGPEYFGSLLQWTESLWSYIPSSTNTKQLIDISLFDHSKITCAIASCIYDYLESVGVTQYKSELFSPYQKTKDFYEKDAFLLFSMDMSGIQEFIYNISGTKALKSLRARSTYLDIMLEYLVDVLLGKLEMSRANLLYTGGGHTYMILPNTPRTLDTIQSFEKECHQWFLDKFTTELSVSMAEVVCSGNDLMNTNGNYSMIWQKASRLLSQKKMRRYDAADIRTLNASYSQGDRECRECLRSDSQISAEGLCPICEGLISISNNLRDNDFFVIAKQGKLQLPFDCYLSVVNKDKAEQSAKENDSAKIYSKNQPFTGKGIVTNLWMSDYDFASKVVATHDQGIASYADRKIGLQRLGVLRADVDNLGMTFINGIPRQYSSLSRTATFSRSLSMFFKFELNKLLSDSKVTVIYSGGDDVFLIGAWDDVVTKAILLREKFREYTQNKLSLSAGIGLYNEKYPVSKMAVETGKLEDLAKQGDKDSITLWTPEKVYTWDAFENNIILGKLSFVREHLENSSERGKSFIYKLLELLRGSDEINLARTAYLLARSNMPDVFTSKLFDWIQNKSDKLELITALEYYVYEIREA